MSSICRRAFKPSGAVVRHSDGAYCLLHDQLLQGADPDLHSNRGYMTGQHQCTNMNILSLPDEVLQKVLGYNARLLLPKNEWTATHSQRWRHCMDIDFGNSMPCMCSGLSPGEVAPMSFQVHAWALSSSSGSSVWLSDMLLAVQCRRLRQLVDDLPVWEEECKHR